MVNKKQSKCLPKINNARKINCQQKILFLDFFSFSFNICIPILLNRSNDPLGYVTTFHMNNLELLNIISFSCPWTSFGGRVMIIKRFQEN